MFPIYFDLIESIQKGALKIMFICASFLIFNFGLKKISSFFKKTSEIKTK